MGLRGPNPRQEISSPGPQRANRLENSNKQSAPVTWKSQRELPGKRKTDGQPENEFIHFLVCPAVFRCALCAQHASEAGCLEAVDCNYVSHCVCSFHGDKHSPFRFLFGRRKGTSSFVFFSPLSIPVSRSAFPQPLNNLPIDGPGSRVIINLYIIVGASPNEEGQ